ncbi:MAG: hypothetical protein U5L01_06450 [Rheinheimera sp.]|nr:hypothetical protein [Rheinheimera sp.]
MLAQVKAIAEQQGLPAAVLVFEPQPLELFKPDLAPARLTRFREKYHWLAATRIRPVDLCQLHSRVCCARA